MTECMGPAGALHSATLQPSCPACCTCAGPYMQIQPAYLHKMTSSVFQQQTSPTEEHGPSTHALALKHATATLSLGPNGQVCPVHA